MSFKKFLINTFITSGLIITTYNMTKPAKITKYCRCHEYCEGKGYILQDKGIFGHNGYRCDCECHE